MSAGPADPTVWMDQLTLVEKAALLSGENIWQTRGIPRLGIPSIWMSDGPHGVRKQRGDADHLGIGESEKAVCFPTSATIANSWDEDLAARIGEALGREASSRDVHVLLGPGLNIKRSPLGGRNFEYFSEDPELSGRLAAAYVRGIQSQGVAATPKHFAANSQELRRMVSDSVVDERTLRELYLTGFEIVVREAAPWAIMSSYNLVNGVYAHENEHLLTDILRREWGFDGVVVSDWGGGNDPVAAVAAGGTVEMPSSGFDSIRAITEAVHSGELAERDVDARVEELFGLIGRVTRNRRVGADAEGHHDLARRAAAESAVLLRNVDGILPLAAGTRVAVIGAFARNPRYQGAGSSLVNPVRLTNLVDAIADTELVLAGHADGFRIDGAAAPALQAQAVRAAASADVALVALGLPENVESEGLDRPDLRLPGNQVELLRAVAATGTPVVAVLSGGGPVETAWLDDTAALVHAYLGGEAGAEALWDVLTGATDPGGRLAETMPVLLADTPTAGRFPSEARTAEYREGLYVGYRYYATAGVEPAFPFGFGLSFTDFAYEQLVVDASGATFTVTNTGARAGSDVAQLYVRRQGGSRVYRPAIELKGFVKIRLAPGERTTITIPFGERTFRFYDTESASWQIEQGTYDVLVGPSSAELPLTASLDIEGTVPAGEPDPTPGVYSSGQVQGVDDGAFSELLGEPLPDREWNAPPFTANTPLEQLVHSPSPIGRLAFRVIARNKRRAERKPHPDLDALFIYDAPFRVIDKMTPLTRRFTDALLAVVNGDTGLRGVVSLARAYVAGRRDERRTSEAFRRASTKTTARQTPRPPHSPHL